MAVRLGLARRETGTEERGQGRSRDEDKECRPKRGDGPRERPKRRYRTEPSVSRVKQQG